VAQLVYDVTVRFCDRYIGKRSRTHDQMVQAARSGVQTGSEADTAIRWQNIAEGSLASENGDSPSERWARGTVKKSELKLTNVARASLEELRLDYQDFLRQRGLVEWPAEHAALRRFKARRVATMEEFAAWVQEELTRTEMDGHGQARTDRKSVKVRVGQWRSAELAANGALSLLNVCCYLLDRQLGAQASAFELEGGFTERLYRVRSEKRRRY